MTPSATRISYWLAVESFELEVGAVASGLVERFAEEGLSLSRLSVSVDAKHPHVAAQQVTWVPGSLEVIERTHNETKDSEYRGSPVALVHAGSGPIRVRLERGEGDEFQISTTLRAAGHTDYLAVPLPFTNGMQNFAAFSSSAPGGFTDAQVELLHMVLPALAVRMEVESDRHGTQSLMRLYLGPTAASRVLGGDFKRGGGQLIKAVIWYSDLRDFTAFCDAENHAAVVGMLDECFEIVAGAIEASGGDVLKFIGDAALGIFPFDEHNRADVSQNALEAAVRVVQSVKHWRSRQRRMTHPTPGLGVALHAGEVMFGNIGSDERLDFTVIGPPVNVVARIEGWCSKLGEPLLLSDQVAAGLPRDGSLREVDRLELKGVAEPVLVFAPAR